MNRFTRLVTLIASLSLASCMASGVPGESAGRTLDGKQVGLWTYWHADGETKRAEGRYRADRQDGPWTYWYEDGTLRWQGEFRRKQLDGPLSHWHRTGVKSASGAMQAGRKTGVWSFWHEDGSLRQTGRYENGWRTGTWTYRHPDGSKSAEGRFAADVKVGSWSYWDSRGNPSEVDHDLEPEEAPSFDPGPDAPPRGPHAGGVSHAATGPPAELLLETDRNAPAPVPAQPWTMEERATRAYFQTLYEAGPEAAAAEHPDMAARYSAERGRYAGGLLTEGFPAQNDAKSRNLKDKPLPYSKVRSRDGSIIDLARDFEGRPIVLVILLGYDGYVCPYCVTQNEILKEHAGALMEAAEVVICYPGEGDALDSFKEGCKLIENTKDDGPFKLVFDKGSRLVEELGIEGNLALPTTLILDETGTVFWAYVGKDKEDRPAAEEILEVLHCKL